MATAHTKAALAEQGVVIKAVPANAWHDNLKYLDMDGVTEAMVLQDSGLTMLTRDPRTKALIRAHAALYYAP